MDRDSIAVIKAFDSFEITEEMDRGRNLLDLIDSLERLATGSPSFQTLSISTVSASNSPNAEEASNRSILHVRVISARGLPESKSMYCKINVDGSQRARSTKMVDAELDLLTGTSCLHSPKFIKAQQGRCILHPTQVQCPHHPFLRQAHLRG